MPFNIFTPSSAASAERAWMDSVEARLQAMETQQRLFNSSVKGGAVTVYTDDLVEVGRLGVGSYGTNTGTVTRPVLAMLDALGGGFQCLIDSEEGWVQPKFEHNFTRDTFVPVTSGSFTNCWVSTVQVSSLGLRLDHTTTCDSGTTGETAVFVAGIQKGTYTTGSGAQEDRFYRIDLSTQTTVGTHVRVKVMSRRLSGSGDVNCYVPSFCISDILSNGGFTESGL